MGVRTLRPVQGHFFPRAHPIAKLALLVFLETGLALVDGWIVDRDLGRRTVHEAGNLLLGAVEFVIAPCKRFRPRANMELRFTVDALRLQATAIHPDVEPCPLKRDIDLLLPCLAETLRATGLARHHHAPARLGIAVAED